MYLNICMTYKMRNALLCGNALKTGLTVNSGVLLEC
jgi:hypothetical protein